MPTEEQLKALEDAARAEGYSDREVRAFVTRFRNQTPESPKKESRKSSFGSVAESLERGFMGAPQRPDATIPERIGHTVGDVGLPTMAAMATAPMALVPGFQATPIAAAMAARGVQSAARQGIQASRDIAKPGSERLAPQVRTGQEALAVGSDVANAGVAEALGQSLGVLYQGAKTATKAGLKVGASGFAGVSKKSAETFVDNPMASMAKAGENYRAEYVRGITPRGSDTPLLRLPESRLFKTGSSDLSPEKLREISDEMFVALKGQGLLKTEIPGQLRALQPQDVLDGLQATSRELMTNPALTSGDRQLLAKKANEFIIWLKDPKGGDLTDIEGAMKAYNLGIAGDMFNKWLPRNKSGGWDIDRLKSLGGVSALSKFVSGSSAAIPLMAASVSPMVWKALTVTSHKSAKGIEKIFGSKGGAAVRAAVPQALKSKVQNGKE